MTVSSTEPYMLLPATVGWLLHRTNQHCIVFFVSLCYEQNIFGVCIIFAYICIFWNFVSRVHFLQILLWAYFAHVILTRHIWIRRCKQCIVLRTDAVTLAGHTKLNLRLHWRLLNEIHTTKPAAWMLDCNGYSYLLVRHHRKNMSCIKIEPLDPHSTCHKIILRVHTIYIIRCHCNLALCKILEAPRNPRNNQNNIYASIGE